MPILLRCGTSFPTSGPIHTPGRLCAAAEDTMVADNRKRIRWAAIGCLLLLALAGCRRLATKPCPAPHRASGAPCDCGSCPSISGPEACQVVPRFHPVPTRPVFSPVGQCAATLPPPAASRDDQSPAAPPARAVPGGRVVPPPPTPEAIPSPPPAESEKSQDPAAPQRLGTASPGFPSWLFAPPNTVSASRKMDPVVELKTDPSAKGTATAKAH